MNKILNTGSELRKTGSFPSVSSSIGSPEIRRWVGLEWNALKEMIPGPLLSDEAARLYLDMLTAIAEEIGPAKFHETVLKAIETCDRRPTIAKFRMLAGIAPRLDPHAEALAEAWALVSLVVVKHVGRDAEGNAVLKPFLRREGAVFHVEHLPVIPEGVRRAVASLGGWGALADSYPQWWGQRLQAFKEVFVGASTTAIAKIPS